MTENFQVFSITSLYDTTNGAITLDSVANAAKCDEKYMKLIKSIKNGFGTTRHLTDPNLREFWDIKDALSVDNYIVFFGNRVVIPKLLRKQILEHL